MKVKTYIVPETEVVDIRSMYDTMQNIGPGETSEQFGNNHRWDPEEDEETDEAPNSIIWE